MVKQLLIAAFLTYKLLVCQSCTVNYGPSFSRDLWSERKVRGLEIVGKKQGYSIRNLFIVQTEKTNFLNVFLRVEKIVRKVFSVL